nr:rhodanese-like domain-containing protein [uncultured Caldimonas sp.]
MSRLSSILCHALVLAAAFAVLPARADVLSAHAAQQAVARGAIVWDVRSESRYAAGHLPGAVQAAWSSGDSLSALQTAVSEAGIDLSREVLLYGDAGDAAAGSLYAELQRVAPGRVHWLVGGVQEWVMSGQALTQAAAVRAPVPQRLVVLRGDQVEHPRMAADALRRTRAWQADSLALIEARAD